MLATAMVKVSLKEPEAGFLEMTESLKGFGTRELFLVHVRHEGTKGEQKAVEAMRALNDKVREQGFDSEFIVRSGHVPTRIAEMAQELAVHYTAIYWRPRNAFRQALLGSIDGDILRLSDSPVFIYNRRLLRPSTTLERVLYATDFRATDRAVLPYLKDRDFAAETLYLLHVGERAPDPHTEARRRERAEKNLARLAAECAHAYDNVETIEVVGRVRGQILRHARLHKTDLIVVGKADKPGPLQQLVGGTARTLPRKARCSVFIIPPQAAGPGGETWIG
jgi:nucleotide-binding universal stress UspA family protein